MSETPLDLPVHPEFAARGSFEHLRLGKNKRRYDERQLMLAKYLDEAVVLPTIPASYDYGAAVPSWPMYGNDRLGDCTCAAVGHLVQAWSAAAGGEKTFDDADVERLYWRTGTPPADDGAVGGPTDDGRSEPDVLNYWRQTGLGEAAYADRITAYAFVDPSNLDLMRAALYLFGGVYVGIELPLTAQGQAVWDVAPDYPDRNQPGSWGGHAVPYVSYGGGRFRCVSWGGLLELTDAFHGTYSDEAYAVISADFLGGAAGKSPAGLDLEALEADLLQVTQR